MEHKELNELALSARTNAEAKERLFARFQGLVLMLARREIEGYDTDDILQESYLALWSAINSYDTEKGNFYAYARACIENRLADASRRAMRKKRRAPGGTVELIDNSNPATMQDPDEALLEREMISEVRSRIALLTKRERSVLELYLKGLSYKQIALALQSTTKSIDNALSRIKSKLR